MSTKTLAIVAGALVATLAACGTDSTTPSTTGGTSSGGTSSGGDATTDTSGTADTASSGGATDSGSSGGTTDSASSSGGTTDTSSSSGSTDTSTSTTCPITDQACLTTCGNEKCAKEQSACSTNPKCAGFLQCLNNCSQNIDPPGEVTGTTCAEKCRTLAGKDAVDAAVGAQGCVLSKCAEVKKCKQNDPNFQGCANVCVQVRCLESAQNCTDDASCGWLLQCLNTCQTTKVDPPWPPKDHTPDAAWLPGGVTPTTCSAKCYGSVPGKSIERFFAAQLCQLSECLLGDYTAPCPQTNATCINNCAFDKCDSTFTACANEPACAGYFACLTAKNCGQDTACSGACQKLMLDTYGAVDANSATSTYSSIQQCAVGQCVGF